MGLCLSCNCGEAQQKAAVVAVSISHGTAHHSALSPVVPPRRPKRYPESSSKLSPRPSLESLGIPHSSELFSLPSDPSSDADTDPARGSIARSSTSSMTSTHLPGRFSCSVRKSCSSQVGPAETSLLETIARLEKLCDVKLLNLVDSGNDDSVVPSAETTTTSILLRDSCRDLALKLRMCFANEHAVAPANLESAALTVPDVEHLEANDVDLQGEVITQNTIAVRRLPSLRSQDGDENIQFTDFEATFELLAAQSTPSASEAAEPAQPPPSSEQSASQFQPAHRRSRTSSELSGLLNAKGKPKGPKNPAMLLRPALTDISANVTEPSRKTPQLMKAQTVKRGSSRSLDLQNCTSLSQLEFDTLLKSSQRWQSMLGAVETSRKESESSRTEAEEPLRTEDCQSIEAKSDSQRTEAEGTSNIESTEDIQTIEAAKESRRIEAVEYRGLEAAKHQGLETAAAEDQGLEAEDDEELEAAKHQGLEIAAEDQGLVKAADGGGHEAADGEGLEAEDPQSLNEAALKQGLESKDSLRTGAGADFQKLSLGDEQVNSPSSSADATPSQAREEVEDDEEGEGYGASIDNNNKNNFTVSDKCLALVFENMLKQLLRQSSHVELAQYTLHLLRLLAVQPASDGAPESSGDNIQIFDEAASSESWHDAEATVALPSTTEQSVLPVLHNTAEDLELLPEVLPEALHNDSSSSIPNLST